MSSRSQAREIRKAEKLARFEASKAGTLLRVALPDGPVADPRFDPPISGPKIGANLPNLDQLLRPNTGGLTGRFAMRMTWCHRKKDVNGSWSWGEVRQWTDIEWSETIEPTLTQMAELTWKEIDSQSSGSGHKQHHGHQITDLAYEAQSRWVAIGLEEFDSVFRFRLGNTRRAWGFIAQAHFCLVWWERQHKIYAVS